MIRYKKKKEKKVGPETLPVENHRTKIYLRNDG